MLSDLNAHWNPFIKLVPLKRTLLRLQFLNQCIVFFCYGYQQRHTALWSLPLSIGLLKYQEIEISQCTQGTRRVQVNRMKDEGCTLVNKRSLISWWGILRHLFVWSIIPVLLRTIIIIWKTVFDKRPDYSLKRPDHVVIRKGRKKKKEGNDYSPKGKDHGLGQRRLSSSNKAWARSNSCLLWQDHAGYMQSTKFLSAF